MLFFPRDDADLQIIDFDWEEPTLSKCVRIANEWIVNHASIWPALIILALVLFFVIVWRLKKRLPDTQY